MKYNRDLYPHWGSSPVEGFHDVRHFVISLAVVSRLNIVDGKVVEGDWFCKYTGKIYRIEDDTPDMEHIWSLKYVHEHGGALTSPEQRRAVANDPRNMIAVHKSSNRKKSYKVGGWLPINGGYWPEYLESIVEVRNAYPWLIVSDGAINRFNEVKAKSHEVRNGFFIDKQKNWFMEYFSITS